ncbi:MAG: LacI family DNA-binding transcriptional regulator [Pseudomonadota bacterium]
MTTSLDIAKAARVSPAVVSRIINQDASLRITAQTRRRVERVIKAMDYAPNTCAQSLRRARTGILALVVHDMTNPVYAEILAGAQDAAASQGKALLLGEAKDLNNGQSRIESLIGGGGADGLILQGAGTALDRALARAARRLMPTVLLQSGHARDTILMRMKDHQAGALACRALLKLGHRRIGFLGVSPSLSFSDDRQKGWHEALTKAGESPTPLMTGIGGNTCAQGADGMKRLFMTQPDLTAVVVANVMAGIGALSYLHDQDIQAGRDFSVIAVHDSNLAAYVRPALSVVRMPLRALGRGAVDAVCGHDFHANTTITIPDAPTVIARASTGPAR